MKHRFSLVLALMAEQQMGDVFVSAALQQPIITLPPCPGLQAGGGRIFADRENFMGHTEPGAPGGHLPGFGGRSGAQAMVDGQHQ